MKKRALLVFVMALIVSVISAQIKVNSAGKVGINGAPTSYDHTVHGTSYTTYMYSYKNYSNGLFSDKASLGGAAVRFAYDGQDYAVKIVGGSETIALDIGGLLRIDGAMYQSSDKRLKNEIKTKSRSSILDRIASVESKQYYMKGKKELMEMHKKGVVSYPVDTVDLLAEATQMMDQRAQSDTAFFTKMNTWDEKEFEKVLKSNFMKKVKKKYDIVELLDSTIAVVADIPSYDTARINYGFYAQDIEPIYPELVDMDSTTGLYSVNYIGFIPINFSAIKELKAENDELRSELDAIRKELADIRRLLKLGKLEKVK